MTLVIKNLEENILDQFIGKVNRNSTVFIEKVHVAMKCDAISKMLFLLL